MKQFISMAGLVSILLSCNEPVKTKLYHFSEEGWAINVPSDLNVMDSAKIVMQNKNGVDAIEKAYDTTFDFSGTRTLISLKKGRLNNFAVTITPYDPEKDGDWNEANQSMKNMLYHTFETQIAGIKIDTSSKVDLVNGMEFKVFKTTLTYPNKKIMKSILYSKLYKGYDFGISITYVDDETGKKFNQILYTSKFEK